MIPVCFFVFSEPVYVSSFIDNLAGDTVSVSLDVNEENHCAIHGELTISAEVAEDGVVLSSQLGVDFADGAITFPAVSRGGDYVCTISVLLERELVPVETQKIQCGLSKW